MKLYTEFLAAQNVLGIGHFVVNEDCTTDKIADTPAVSGAANPEQWSSNGS